MSTTLRSYPDSQRAVEVKDNDTGKDNAIQTKNGFVSLTKTTSGEWSLAAPTSGTDDGSLLTLLNASTVDHSVALPTSPTTLLPISAGKTAYLSAFNGQWNVG